MTTDVSYKKVFPIHSGSKTQVVERACWDFHTNEIKIKNKQLDLTPSINDINIGKRIGVFTLVFIQSFNLKRDIFQLYNFMEPKLFYEFQSYIKKHRTLLENRTLFSNSIKLNEVIIQHYFEHKMHAISYINDIDEEKFLCFELFLSKKLNRWLVKNIEMLIGNRIKKFGE
jgi:hypothetical protein